MNAVRHWLPAAICLAGVALMVITRTPEGLEGGGLLISAGLSVWLLNILFRLGVRGDRERDAEDRARQFFDEHGHWPDEPPPPGPPPQPPGDARRVPRHGRPRRR